MKKFIYPIPNDLLPLMQSTIVDFVQYECYGYMPDGLAGQMHHCTLFLMCDFEERDGNQIYRDPVVIVAKNDAGAAEAYSEATNGKLGFILHRITENCSKIVVRPCDD